MDNIKKIKNRKFDLNKNSLLSDPSLDPYPFYCFLADRDPTDDEPLVYQGYEGLILFWQNTTTDQMFISTDNTLDPLVWDKIVTSENADDYISSYFDNLGWFINTSRSASSITPPSFNTSRQPSTENDVFVSANILFSAILSLNAQVNIEISTDDTNWQVYGKAKQQISIAANIIQQLYALVPKGSYYRFTSSGSGGSIDSILEIKM